MQQKAEIAIAKRSVEEILLMDGAVTDQLLRRIGIRHSTFYGWVSEYKVPNTNALQNLALHGFDVYYILTGRRKNNENHKRL